MKSTESTSLYHLKDVQFEFLQKRNTKKWWQRRKASDTDESGGAGEFALGPLDLELRKGKLTSILGRSGSGKTTLLSLLGLLRRPIQGELTVTLDDEAYEIAKLWDDEEKLEAFRANHIGFALQKGELLPYLTLHENAEIILKFLGRESKKIEKSLAGIFGRLYEADQERKSQQDEIKRLIHSKPLAVSQGQYQRGAIARALANQPPILLADEPTGNLDELTAPQVIQIFREIVDKSVEEEAPKSVIMVTHDMLLAIEYADEIIVLSQGKQVAHYTAQKGDEKMWHRKAEEENEQYTSANLKEQLLKDMGEERTEERNAET
jgi:ABC-type lipoprotein export system ATPase subunit